MIININNQRFDQTGEKVYTSQTQMNADALSIDRNNCECYTEFDWMHRCTPKRIKAGLKLM